MVDYKKQGKANRIKGHTLERKIAADLRHIFPRACRNLEYQEGMGIDLRNAGDFDIQCKSKKEYVSINTFSEIPQDNIPILVTKANRKPIMAVLKWRDLLKLIEGYEYQKEKRASSSNGGKE